MRGHNICFRQEIRKIIIQYSLLSRALTQIITIIIIKNRTVRFYNTQLHPEDAKGMTNSVDTHQTALL